MQKLMILNKNAIVSIATKVNVHPIHIKIYMSRFANVLIEDVEDGYKKYTNGNPRPFVKWVGNFRNL